MSWCVKKIPKMEKHAQKKSKVNKKNPIASCLEKVLPCQVLLRLYLLLHNSALPLGVGCIHCSAPLRSKPLWEREQSKPYPKSGGVCMCFCAAEAHAKGWARSKLQHRRLSPRRAVCSPKVEPLTPAVQNKMAGFALF